MKANIEKSLIFNGRHYYPKGNGYYYNSHTRKHLHQAVWEYYNGPIPKGCEVHHKNLNREDNDISNLQLLTSSEHKKLHAELLTDERKQTMRDNMLNNALPAACDWHKSEEGRAWHKQHIQEQIVKGRLNRKIKFNCSMCGKEFESVARNLSANHFCSNNCRAKFLRRKRSQDKSETRVCEICGREYKTNPWSNSKTCSRSCANVVRAKTVKERRGQ